MNIFIKLFIPFMEEAFREIFTHTRFAACDLQSDWSLEVGRPTVAIVDYFGLSFLSDEKIATLNKVVVLYEPDKAIPSNKLNRPHVSYVSVNDKFLDENILYKLITTPGFTFSSEHPNIMFDDVTLNHRERMVCFYLCEGHRTGDIAKTLGLSEKSVATYKYNAMNKLNVKDPAGLSKKLRYYFRRCGPAVLPAENLAQR
jgi:DNA-binding CsgD family transcriptional regulator